VRPHRPNKEITLLELTLFTQSGMLALLQVLMIDIVLAGDNAVVIGMAAARVAPALRNKVIFWGLAAAVVLRVMLAAIAVKLLAIVGLTLAGGILLLWVCWRMWRDIRCAKGGHEEIKLDENAGLKNAIIQIVVADVSMSLDNVLGVAGAARNHMDVLIIGLLLSVALMGAAANIVARLLEKVRWISYVGLIIVLYVAVTMVWEGGHQVLNAFH
jgi:YjbE family integral membrane protein